MGTSLSTSENVTKIVPIACLGDSMSVGIGYWRLGLFQALEDAGYIRSARGAFGLAPQTVGPNDSLTTAGSANMHSGHNGTQLVVDNGSGSSFYNRIPSQITPYNPRIVIIYSSGINDINVDRATSSILSDMETLLDALAAVPNVERIITSHCNVRIDKETATSDLNAGLSAAIATEPKARLVNPGFDAADTSGDKVHLSASGTAKLVTAFYNAVVAFLTNPWTS